MPVPEGAGIFLAEKRQGTEEEDCGRFAGRCVFLARTGARRSPTEKSYFFKKSLCVFSRETRKKGR